MSPRTCIALFAVLASLALAPAARAECTLSVDIYGPDSKCSGGSFTLVAYPQASPSAYCTVKSCDYTWYYRWCETGSVPNPCPSTWYSYASGSDTIQDTMLSFDKYLDYKVVATCTVTDCATGDVQLTATDTHRVYGPQSFYCGGGGGGPL